MAHYTSVSKSVGRAGFGRATLVARLRRAWTTLVPKGLIAPALRHFCHAWSVLIIVEPQRGEEKMSLRDHFSGPEMLTGHEPPNRHCEGALATAAIQRL